MAAVLVLSGCGQSADPDKASLVDEDGMHGLVLSAPYTMADGTLTDTGSDDYDLRDDTTKPLTLVFFGYTHCPDICLAVMADIAVALTRLDEDEAEDVGMLFITSDPKRDDPASLREYLDRFDETFEGLTGPLDDIVDVANSLHIPIETGAKLPSGGYEVAHGTAIVGVLPDGSAPILWTEGTSAAKLAEDLHVILADGLPSLRGTS